MLNTQRPEKHKRFDYYAHFDWLHSYRAYEVDPALCEDPIVFSKRKTFEDMVAQQKQGRDTLMVLLATAILLIGPFPLVSGLPRINMQGLYYFLSTAFQGFSALLGLLGIALVYQLQQGREFLSGEIEDVKRFLSNSRISTESKNPLEMWKSVESYLRSAATRRNKDMSPKFVELVIRRINYCTQLEFDGIKLQSECFSLLPPFLLLLVISILGLAASCFERTTEDHLGWCFVISTIGLSSLIVVRGFMLARRHFWVNLKTIEGPPGTTPVFPPDSYPGPLTDITGRTAATTGPVPNFVPTTKSNKE